jgi:DNA-binding FadR family transcriptional regulator
MSPPLLARPARLGHVVVSSLIERIASGRFPAGSPLPPEPALCQEFNVSRSVVRESVKLLEEKGLVLAKQGQGTNVLPPDRWNLLDPEVLAAFIRHDHSLTIFDDLIEVRAALEVQMARRAAIRMTEEQMRRLEEHLHTLESLLDDPHGYAKADLVFHDLIGQFSNHALARSVLKTVQPIALAHRYYGATHRTRADNVRSHRGHVKIYKALSQRDHDAAAQAVERHILGSWAIYKRSLRRATKRRT